MNLWYGILLPFVYKLAIYIYLIDYQWLIISLTITNFLKGVVMFEM